MPKVIIEMLQGRTLDQKRELVERLTDVLVETMNVSRETVHVMLHENPSENVAQGGRLFCDRK
jgi:4-oxalocrotonate tautomerase